jgi:tetratricopeptide (TPR) repeat protein
MSIARIIAPLALLVSSALLAMNKPQADSLVAQGQKAYISGDFAVAAQAFDSAATVFNSAGLQLDLGNSWFKQGEIARAILHYERGLLISPGDPDLRANLAFANEQVKDRLAQDGALVLGGTWARFRGGADPDQWARRALYASLLFFILLASALVLRDRTWRRAIWTLTVITSVILVVSVLFAAARHRELVSHGHAIIMQAKADARSEPRNSGKVLFVLHKGTKVAVEQVENGWTEVRLPNGTVGWMPPASLERI